MNIKLKSRAIILKNNKVLLVRDTRAGKFFLPGGTLESGENIVESLKREIIEELGIKPIIGKIAYSREYETYDLSKGVEFVFFVENINDFDNIDRSKCTHANEWDVCDFFEISDLDKMDVYPHNLGELIKENLKKTSIYLL